MGATNFRSPEPANTVRHVMVTAKRQEVKDSNPGIAFKDVGKVSLCARSVFGICEVMTRRIDCIILQKLGEMWKAASEEEKKPFVEKYKAAKGEQSGGTQSLLLKLSVLNPALMFVRLPAAEYDVVKKQYDEGDDGSASGVSNPLCSRLPEFACISLCGCDLFASAQGEEAPPKKANGANGHTEEAAANGDGDSD